MDTSPLLPDATALRLDHVSVDRKQALVVVSSSQPTGTCPACGLGLTPMGEEISEQLDIIPAQFFVRRHIRAKYSCRHCETVHTAPLPAQPIDRGLAAPGLLAHVLAAKYLDHLPLHRQ